LQPITEMGDVSDSDLQILREKSRTFLGAFKIPLSKLRLEDIPQNPRQRDDKNVSNLIETFDLARCKKLQSEQNYVSALISRTDLPQGNRYNAFDEPQYFDPPQPLICLEGEHRLKAADKFLAGEERWWVANLYSDGISFGRIPRPQLMDIDINEQTKTAIREFDPGSAKYFDGDIYRHYRIAALRGETDRAKEWLARLRSKEKRKNVSRFERLNMRDVRNGFDDLIPFTGIWIPFDLSHLRRIMDLHCPEVAVYSPILLSSNNCKRSWFTTWV
jgi:hypothetical protein